MKRLLLTAAAFLAIATPALADFTPQDARNLSPADHATLCAKTTEFVETMLAGIPKGPGEKLGRMGVLLGANPQLAAFGCEPIKF